MNTALVGINWGDEGKGRMVDLLARDYDVVVRFQGGNNAGHTIINSYGKNILNLLPSGVFHKGVLNVLGTGMVVDIEHLAKEIDSLKSSGLELTPDTVAISDRATICMPYHRDEDVYEEERLAGKQFGSTRKGIAYCYGDRNMKKTLLIGDLYMSDADLMEYLEGIMEWKNLTLQNVYRQPAADIKQTFDWLREYGNKIMPYVKDTGILLRQADKDGRDIMFEGQLGALRDLYFGIYPYTTSSSPLSSFAPIGSGAPSLRIDKTMGIIKAYSSCVGEGPFVVEQMDAFGDKLREAGGEYGAVSGRPRRVGALDMVASKYGCNVQGADELALTKLDVLSYMDEIPVCVAYEIDGKRTTDFPFTSILNKAKPIFETMPGWKEDIGGIRKFEDLPKTARDYILYIEKELDCPITYISVGAAQEEYIRR